MTISSVAASIANAVHDVKNNSNQSICASLADSSFSNLSITQETSSERDSDDCYADVGFMFEGCQPSTLKRFQWVRPTNGEEKEDGTASVKPEVRIALHVVDEEPGALQSGHYLWPAAPMMAQFLVDLSHVSQWEKPKNIMELGAGCALVSLTALQIMHESLHCIVITDHDPGTLERARDNYETTLEDLLESTESDEEQLDCINGISSIPVLFESLAWGNNEDVAQRVASAAAEHSYPLLSLIESVVSLPVNPNYNMDRNIFDLMLGSDLIYCREVVEPLLQTVSYLMSTDGSFLLSQSSRFDDEIEQSIDEACQALNLERTILWDTLREGEGGGARIQQFVWPHQTSDPDIAAIDRKSDSVTNENSAEDSAEDIPS